MLDRETLEKRKREKEKQLERRKKIRKVFPYAASVFACIILGAVVIPALQARNGENGVGGGDSRRIESNISAGNPNAASSEGYAVTADGVEQSFSEKAETPEKAGAEGSEKTGEASAGDENEIAGSEPDAAGAGAEAPDGAAEELIDAGEADASADEAVPDDAKLNRAAADEALSDEEKPDQAVPDEAKPDEDISDGAAEAAGQPENAASEGSGQNGSASGDAAAPASDRPEERPMIALTFDDGPGEYTGMLLDCLGQYQAHATFFMLGECVKNYPDIPERVLSLGCQIGNHTWNHPNLLKLSAEEVIRQFSDTDKAIYEVTGTYPEICRASYGAGNQQIVDLVQKPFFMWSVDTEDWKVLDADADYETVMNGDLSDGTIILMHDIHEPTVRAALRIIPELVSRGYNLVTISEMAKAKHVDLQNVTYTDFWDSSIERGAVPGYTG